MRITEMNFFQSASTFLEQQKQLVELTLYQAGHRFVPYKEDVVRELLPLLRRNGLQNIQTRQYNPEYHVETPEGNLLAEKIAYSYRAMRPFLQKWTRLPDNYDEGYQQLLQEMQRPGFTATWPLLTIWGTVAPKQAI